MLKMNKLKAIVATGLMVLTVFTALSSVVAADGPRATGEVKPSWESNPSNIWEYRFDETDLSTYVYFRGTITDGAYTVLVEQRMTPINSATQRKWTCTGVNPTAAEYKLTQNFWWWENGTEAVVVTDNDGDPAYTNGQVLASGSYVTTQTANGDAYYNMHNLNFKRGTITANLNTNAGSGQTAWTLAEKDDITETTTNGDMTEYKPTWDTSPMQVGDTWKQLNQYTSVANYDETLSGMWSGGGKGTVTRNYFYKYDWSVASKASKTISSTKKGSTTFPEAYKTTRTGSFDWDATDGTNSNSGTVTPGPYEQWYAGDGDNFDAGWNIESNATTHIINSNYIAFINTRPAFSAEIPETTINSDEVWNFKNGVDYAVTDPDPGIAGQLGYTIKKALGTNTNVLKNLTIDPDTGDITFTPNQKDVADLYQITINATDKYDKGPLGADKTFTLNIKNKNHAPTVTANIMQAFTMKEGETNTPTWKLSDAFHDSDMDPNPLMANAAYDTAEKLTYSVANNGSVRILCTGADITVSNNCAAISFAAIDGKFPRDQPVAMTITATDKAGQKISGQITVTVQHVNHAPKAVKDKFTYDMEEDTPATLELKTYFKDQDINVDNNYVTGDTWSFDHDGEAKIKVDITGSKAKMTPDQDWNGKEEITFTATDKVGAKASSVGTINVKQGEDAPKVTSVTPPSDPTIFETTDGKEASQPGFQKFTVTATDVDNTVGVSMNQVLSYNWTVEDDAQTVFKVDTHTNEYVFTATFDCDFENGKFCGGDSSKTYYVTAHVNDGVLDVEGKKWYITVKNVNRAPVISDIEVFIMDKGVPVPLVATTPGNYSVKYGKVVEFNVENKVTDLDILDSNQKTDLTKLTFEWNSNLVGAIGSTSKVDVGAGKKGTAPLALSAGKTHIITVRVSDQDQGSDSFAITVKVGKQPAAPGFEGVLMVIALFVAVGVVYYRYRK